MARSLGQVGEVNPPLRIDSDLDDGTSLSLPVSPLSLPSDLQHRIFQVGETVCLAVRPDLPVGGRLSHFVDKWRQVTTDKWVLEVVDRGLAIDLLETPPFQGILFTRSSRLGSETMNQEIEALLEKQVIVPLSLSQAREGFYSTYFTVPKKDGGLRPILNLKRFNNFVRVLSFRMETLRTIISVVRPGMWLASVDLKDAYLHVPMREVHHRYLRFAWRGQAYQFQAMPFGLSTAPRAFTKILQPLIAYLRMQGISLYAYLDDILLVASTREELAQAVVLAVRFLSDMGFILNLKKSDLEPSQDLVYLGARFRTDLGAVFLPPPKVEALVSLARTFMQVGQYKPALMFLSLIGLMAASIDMVQYARLAMRPIQWYLKDRWTAALGLRFPILVTRELRDLVLWWTVESNLRQGIRLHPPPPRLVLTSDASLEGWGGYLHGEGLRPQLTQGEWSQQEKLLHINVLELRAVRLACQRFEASIAGSPILIESDNTTTVSYLNRQGGVHSRQLNREVGLFFQWLIPRGILLTAVYRPGVDNTLADFLSRHRADSREWSLSSRVVTRLFALWGTPQVDLFATGTNHKLPLFFSRLPDPQAAGVDGLSLCWSGRLLYAFPPQQLLMKVVSKVMSDRASLILVAPQWPRRPWYSHLLQLSCEIPRLLPRRFDLLTQTLSERGTLYHGDLATMQLVAWKLSGCVSDVKAFQRKLWTLQRQQSGLPPGESMMLAGQRGTVGVVNGVTIPLLPL